LAHFNGQGLYELDAFQSMMLDIRQDSQSGSKVPAIKVTGMPGKHVSPGVLTALNDLAKAASLLSQLHERNN
jgi:hypothetical protein